MADEATSVIRPLTRKRKVLFAVIATMLAFLLLEAAARAYSVVRFRNTAALWHGATLVQRLTSGEVEPALTNAGRLQQEQATDAVYVRRTDRSLLPIRRGASVELNNGVPATVNSLGLRGPEITTTAAPNTIRIGVFGGSYVFGAYLSDEEAWPSLLAQNLRVAGVNAEVLNAGVNGFNIHDVLETLIRLSHATRLDYVVVTSAYNNHSLLPMERTASWARRLDFYLYNLSMLHVIMQEKLSRLRGEPIEFGLYFGDERQD